MRYIGHLKKKVKHVTFERMLIMNQYIFSTAEDDWLASMKKELLENRKAKEILYNFNFEEDRPAAGKLNWNTQECKLKPTQ